MHTEGEAPDNEESVMAVDMFLDIDGVEGESFDETYKGKIQVLSWSWGESNQGSGGFGGGQGAGKVSMQDFSFVMRFCKASPVLLLHCASGEHFDKAVLTCRKAGGGKQVEYLKVTFTHLMISSYQTGASSGGDEYPTDSISFNYETVEYKYTTQDAKGKAEDPIPAGWNVKENKKL